MNDKLISVLNQSENQTESVETPIETDEAPANEENLEKPKKSVSFKKVDLYFFDRCQGYLSIPSSDNDTNSITLGMQFMHCTVEKFESQEDF